MYGRIRFESQLSVEIGGFAGVGCRELFGELFEGFTCQLLGLSIGCTKIVNIPLGRTERVTRLAGIELILPVNEVSRSCQ